MKRREYLPFSGADPPQEDYRQIKTIALVPMAKKARPNVSLLGFWRSLIFFTLLSHTSSRNRDISSSRQFNTHYRAQDSQVGVDSGNYFSLWLHLEVIFILLLMIYLTNVLLSLNNGPIYAHGHYISLEDYQGARHNNFFPPNVYKPCDHDFRDSPENCAIISEVVLIGSAISFESSLPYNRYLYYANIRVRSVLKTPRYMIYPIRPNHIIKIGIFNYHQDRARCMANIHLFRDYFFFQNRPQWDGISTVAQLPQEYNDDKMFDIREALYGQYQALAISYLKPSENLTVTESDNVKLECRAEGRPSPRITWLFQGNEIQKKFIKISPDERISSIDLLNLTQANQGNYTCLAKNAYGSIERSIYIEVKEKKIIMPITTPRPHPCHNYCQNGSCYLDGGIPMCRCNLGFWGRRCTLSESIPWPTMRASLSGPPTVSTKRPPTRRRTQGYRPFFYTRRQYSK